MDRHRRARGIRIRGPILAGAAASLLLGGCEGPLPDVHVARGDIRNAIARGEMTSPRAATVALVSLEGGPDALQARFRQALVSEAANREITVSDEASARYLVRGYLSAYPTEAGTDLSYVYDVFDAGQRRRIRRVNDTITVPAAGGDAWGAVNDAVVTSLAARSADDLAVALAGTPEAQAAREGAGNQVAAAAPDAVAAR